MIITLSLPYVEPITLNTATKYRVVGKFVKTYKSKQYQELIKTINMILQVGENKNQVKQFNEYYNPEKHYLSAEYRFYYPILTKKNLISKVSKDISNLVKPIEDCIFNHLNVDDSQLITTTVTKIHSEEVKSIIQLSIGELHHIA